MWGNGYLGAFAGVYFGAYLGPTSDEPPDLGGFGPAIFVAVASDTGVFLGVEPIPGT